jgi:hypothetical protein
MASESGRTTSDLLLDVIVALIVPMSTCVEQEEEANVQWIS